MILDTKSACIIAGPLIRNPETRQVGNSSVTKFPLRYDYEPPVEGERRKGKILDVDAWGDLSDACSSLRKDDYVLVIGEMRSREYNGKTYWTLRAEAVFPDVRIGAAPLPFASANSAPTPTVPAFDGSAGAMYPGEPLQDYSLNRTAAPDPMGEATILGDDEDLPF